MRQICSKLFKIKQNFVIRLVGTTALRASFSSANIGLNTCCGLFLIWVEGLDKRENSLHCHILKLYTNKTYSFGLSQQ
jgi:hypothetical protein